MQGAPLPTWRSREAHSRLCVRQVRALALHGPIGRMLLYALPCAGPNSTVLSLHHILMGHSLRI